MTSLPVVFTPETLAERWQVSGRTIRNMIDRGELTGFRLGGKLLRISADEVHAKEQAWQIAPIPEPGGSIGTGEHGPRSDTTRQDVENVVSLARIEARQSGRSPD